MNIIACCKVVPEEQDIAVNADRSLNISAAVPKIGQYDLNALEAAAVLAASVEGSQVTALSLGDKAMLESSKIRKNILSRGPDALTLVMDDELSQALPVQTAKVLSAAVRKIGFDLVLCGEGSNDMYSQQVGLLLGEMLEVPCINAVSSLTLEKDALIVERVLEDEMEVLRVPLPAVICLTSDSNVPRIPSMKAILAAGKKSVSCLSCEELGVTGTPPLSHMASVLAPERRNRLGHIMEGDTDEVIAAFASELRKALQ